MAWLKFRDARQQEWLLQQEGLWLFCQQYAYAQLMNERARVVPAETPWYGPNISNVEVNFDNFRERKIRNAERTYDVLTRASLLDGANIFSQLVQMKDELDLYTARFADMKRRVAQDNASSIESHVKWIGLGITGMRFVRDAAATAVLAMATVATGGAAAVAAGTADAAAAAESAAAARRAFAGGRMAITAVGSAMKGLSAYEDSVLSKGVSWSDSGSIGAGLITATSTFVVNAIPILSNLGKDPVKQSVLILVKAPMSAFSAFAVGMTKGDSISKSLASALFSAGISAVPFNAKIKNWALPIFAKVSWSQVGTGAAASFVHAGANMGGAALADLITAKPKPHVSAQVSNLVGVATHIDRSLSSADYIRRTALRSV